MRFLASGLVGVSVVIASVVAVAGGGGCGDRKSGGLPPAEAWKAPAGSGAAAAPQETPDERLARCAATVFVADAVRDGNLPTGILEQLAGVPDPQAIVVLRALQHAAARFPVADQHAGLLAESTFQLVERGETASARPLLERAAGLLGRGIDHEMRASIAAATIARTYGRLGDASAVERLGGTPFTGPFLARGLAEGGHDALADDTYARLMTVGELDPLAAAELPVVDLVRGRLDLARGRIAGRPADWRGVHALILATAAVERAHPEARALVAEAARELDAVSGAGPAMILELAELQHAVGDTTGAAQRRAGLRVALASERDERRAWQALSNLHGLAVRARAADEAGAILADLEARRAPPWMLALTRGQGLVIAGELKAAIEDVERLPVDLSPPRGVVYVEVLLRYFAGPRDPALERWLDEHICR